MQILNVTHAQMRYGQADDAPRTDVLAVKPDDSGVYFTGTHDSAYRWGCSRTYRNMNLDAALRAFMYENGQRLISWEPAPKTCATCPDPNTCRARGYCGYVS